MADEQRHGGEVRAATTDDPDLVVFAAPLRGAIDAGLSVVAGLAELGFGRWHIEWESVRASGEGFLLVDRRSTPLAAVEPLDDTARRAPLGVVRRCAELVATIADTDLRLEAEQARLRQALADAATDELTKLPNRRSWRQVLQREAARSERHGLPLAVVIIDVDNLKQLNDEHGHLAGDVCLRLTADVLRDAVRAEDVVARIGGDEFAVLAVDHEPPGCDALVERICAALADADISASVGGALHAPGEAVATTVRRADDAMYADKRRRRAGEAS